MADIIQTENSVPKKYKDLGGGAWAPVVAIEGGGGGGGGAGADREVVVTTYRVRTAFSGASVGDIITSTQILDVTSTPTTVGTIWRNQTTATDLVTAPLAANIELVGSDALTNAQLRASAVQVSSDFTRGTGNVDANTQRVTLASDEPTVSNLQQINTKTPALVNGAVPITAPSAIDVTASNITTKFRDAFEVYTPGTNWTQTIGSGDLVYVDGNSAAASYLVVSKSPLAADTETRIESTLTFGMPIEFAFGAHLSQRTLGQEFSIEVVDTQTLLPDISDIGIDTILQSTTTLTVTTITPHGLSVGRAIGIRSVLDSRVNYPALVVASVLSPTQFTCTAGPNGTIVSQSAYTTTVLAATTAALPASVYANGTAGVGATLTASANGVFPDQDGVAIPLNGRVLVKNEAAGANNGVYVLTQVGTASTPWILTRATDLDTAAELTTVAGALFAVAVYVTGGTAQAQREYYLSATVTTVGTTAVTWVDSGTVGPLGFVFVRQRLGRAQNGVSQIFENVTATNASLYIRSEAGDALPSGTITTNHSATINTTASVQLSGNIPYTYSFAPTSEYRMFVQADRTQWADSAVDAVTQTTSRLLRTQVCPDPSVNYRLRIRANNAKSLTVPNAQIVSAAKTGTTTATVITATPHGLVVGDLIVAYGTRDQTNFANLATAVAVASVVNSTTFTVVWGTAVTATTYGGFIARVQGGNLLSSLGVVGQTAQSATLTTLADGTRQLTLAGSGAWTAPATTIGDLVELVGVRDAVTGTTSLGVDGPWKIANASTTNLVLVLPFSGQRSLPADFATTNCGGGVLRRTDLRLSFVRVFDYKRERVELLARPGGDMGAAAPVVLQGGTLPAVTTVTTVTGVTTVSTVTAVTTVTTVTTLTSMSQIAGIPANTSVYDWQHMSAVQATWGAVK